jgi:uncharacterized protein (AIM24 family)
MSTLAAVNLKNPSSATNNVVLATNGDLQFNSGYGSAATAYGCRAWANFNGTGTVAIRASGNVSSITDNGTGDYTVNFTTALVDANYAFSFGAGSGNGRVIVLYNGTFNTADSSSAKAAGSIRIAYLELGAGSTQDNAQIAVSIFR